MFFIARQAGQSVYKGKTRLSPHGGCRIKRPMSAQAASSHTDAELVELMRKVDIRVGRMLSVEKHPNAEKLYVESADLGEPNGPRTVVSGLVPYFSPEQIKDRLCLFVANLKPATMRGVTSQAMVLVCHDSTQLDKLEFLEPPASALPGDRVSIVALITEDVVLETLNPKKKVFESLQPHFSIRASDGTALFLAQFEWTVQGKGRVIVPTIRSGSIS